MLKKFLVLFAAAFLMSACDDSKPAAAPPPPPPPPAIQNFMVFFDWDSTKLSDASMNTLQQAATAFKTKGSARVTATGYTDTSGSEAYNMALSLRRANAVKDALVREGVPATAIAVVGKGETNLLVPTGPNVREPQNRRVEIAVGGMMAAPPPTNDLAYCKAMSAKYREFARANMVEGPAAAAIAQCDAGDTAAAIPALEKILRDNKIVLPPRS